MGVCPALFFFCSFLFRTSLTSSAASLVFSFFLFFLFLCSSFGVTPFPSIHFLFVVLVCQECVLCSVSCAFSYFLACSGSVLSPLRYLLLLPLVVGFAVLDLSPPSTSSRCFVCCFWHRGMLSPPLPSSPSLLSLLLLVDQLLFPSFSFFPYFPAASPSGCFSGVGFVGSVQCFLSSLSPVFFVLFSLPFSPFPLLSSFYLFSLFCLLFLASHAVSISFPFFVF